MLAKFKAEANSGRRGQQLSLTLLKQLLKAHGYEVLETPEGLQALDLARDEQPDLILMDIRLPDISGFEVTPSA